MLEPRDFGIILDMDWLAMYHANVDCFSKEVTFDIPDKFELVFKGVKKPLSMISAIQIYRKEGYVT